jgi:uncharacterized protein (DUF362 family)
MAKLLQFDPTRRTIQAQQQQLAATKRHKDAEVIRRWNLRQSIETISRRMRVGTLYVQEVIRESGFGQTGKAA